MRGILALKMAGEIVFSEKPGDTLKKWREIFGLTQKEMADLLEINPSVVCDFEKGRRDSPGIKTVKKMVDTMILYDENNGNKVINSRIDDKSQEDPMIIGEFISGINVNNLQFKKKFSSCYQTLMELGVKRQNMVFALNKTESMSDKEIKEKIEQLDLLENNNWIPISAVSGKNIEQLKILIKQNLDSTRKITSNGNQK